MPDKATIEKAREDAREGKSPSTQAGEFVRAEIDKIRQGKHGARSAKQAIAIGLSEARRSGVKLPPPKKGQASAQTRKKAEQDTKRGKHPNTKVSLKRSRARVKALQKEPRSTVSKAALSKQTKSAARRRGKSDLRRAGRKAAQTRHKRAA